MGIEGGLGTRKHLGVKVRTWAGSPGAFWSHRVLGDSRARDPPSSNSTGLCVKQVVGAEYSSHGVIVQVLDRGGRAHKGCGKSGNSEGEGLWQGPGTLRQGKLTRLAGGTWAWPRWGVAWKGGPALSDTPVGEQRVRGTLGFSERAWEPRLGWEESSFLYPTSFL